MRRLRHSILRRYGGRLNPSDFVLALDDTANPKFGRSIFRCGVWHDGSHLYTGQKIIVLALVDIRRDFAIPLAYVIAPNKNQPDYVPGLELALTLLDEAKASGFNGLAVATDSWFDAKEFIRGVADRGFTYAGEIKAQRRAQVVGDELRFWRKLPCSFFRAKRRKIVTRCDNRAIRAGQANPKTIREETIRLRGLEVPLRAIAVYNRANGRDAFAFYATTDLSMTGERLWEVSRARWRIERMFRDLKQNLSFGRLPCRGREGADLAVCLPFCLLVELRLGDDETWNTNSKVAIGTRVAAMRERTFSEAIVKITAPGNGHLVDRLRARRQPERMRQKPRDEPAGRMRRAVGA